MVLDVLLSMHWQITHGLYHNTITIIYVTVRMAVTSVCEACMSITAHLCINFGILLNVCEKTHRDQCNRTHADVTIFL